jgi:hypothetical protein
MPQRTWIISLCLSEGSRRMESKELRRVRDRSKVLEAENTALQWRCKEQETHTAEWEQRADEHEAMLAEVQAALENAEDHAAQRRNT